MHPIFSLPNPDRCRTIKQDVRMSICLHELGHYRVARHFGAPFAAIMLPELPVGPRADGPTFFPSTMLNTAGASQTQLLSIYVAGYAGELCLFDKAHVQSGGEIHVCAAGCANDAAAIMSIGKLPITAPNDTDDIQRVLVGCIQALQFEPYNILYGDVVGFRRAVSVLYAQWKAVGFRGLAFTGDTLD